MAWFRKPAGDPLTVSMAGIKLGDRLLVVGCSDTGLVAALAVKSGLTGRACMVCASDAERARASVAVEQAGALVESFASHLTALPFEADSFDVVVLRNVLPALDPGMRTRCVEDVRRVVRPGGRCIAIDDAAPGGLAALAPGHQHKREYVRSGGAASVLAEAGFRGVRTLAQREALVFVEGIRAGHGDGQAQQPLV